MANEDPDIKRIETLIALMKENDLVEVEITHGDDKIALKRSQPYVPGVTTVMAPAAGTPHMPIPAPADTNVSDTESLPTIESPMVGTFYQAPSPDSDPFVTPGSRVTPQTVVCIIEAMKVMNEIKAETTGTIEEILVANGAAVEYGQALFKVRPDA